MICDATQVSCCLCGLCGHELTFVVCTSSMPSNVLVSLSTWAWSPFFSLCMFQTSAHRVSMQSAVQ